MLDQRAQIVREQAVEADVSETKLVVTTMKLLLPIRAEGKDRVAAADGVLLGMPQCSGALRQAGSKSCRHDCHNLLTSAPSRSEGGSCVAPHFADFSKWPPNP